MGHPSLLQLFRGALENEHHPRGILLSSYPHLAVLQSTMLLSGAPSAAGRSRVRTRCPLAYRGGRRAETGIAPPHSPLCIRHLSIAPFPKLGWSLSSLALDTPAALSARARTEFEDQAQLVALRCSTAFATVQLSCASSSASAIESAQSEDPAILSRDASQSERSTTDT